MLAAEALPLSDALLECQIASHLANTNRQGLRSLAVNVVGGSVTLRGSVASFYEKQLAIQACRVLAGIDRLIDAVEVASAN